MAQRSDHLESFLRTPSQSALLRVVYLDIEKYSLRRLGIQAGVVNRFTKCMEEALLDVSRYYLEYAQAHGLNFRTDIITLPTGDGAAVCFSFQGLQGIYLLFAKRMLATVSAENARTPCPAFEAEGWCNCHNHFRVRVGLSAGQGIIYKDFNGNYNVAGDVINMAARVMAKADGGQVLLTPEAYDDITGPAPAEGEDTADALSAEDVALASQFDLYPQVKIKHDVLMDVFQYRGRGEPYLNTGGPSLIKTAKSEGIRLLEGDEIWTAVIEMVKTAKERIRVVFLASRPPVPDAVLEALASRIERQVEYEIALIHRKGDAMDLFHENHKRLLKKIQQSGAERRYRLYNIEIDNPICFDTIIIDNNDVGIGFTRVASEKEIQSAIAIEDRPAVVAKFIDWFERYIKRKAEGDE